MFERALINSNWRDVVLFGAMCKERLLAGFPPASEEKLSAAVAVPLHLACGGSVGYLAWGDGSTVTHLLWCLALPLMFGFVRSKWLAFALMAGYFGASSRGLPNAVLVFYAEYASARGAGILLWVMAVCLLALPFGLLWHAQRRLRSLGFVFSLLALIVTPLAIIGWTNPLTVAGVLYPGLSWAGIFLALVLIWAMAERAVRTILVLGVLSFAANVTAICRDIKTPPRWGAIDTHFPGMSGGAEMSALALMDGLRRVKAVSDFAKSIPANAVLVLPETLLGTYDGIERDLLNETSNALARRSSTILVGAEVPQANGQYANAVVALGNRSGRRSVVVQNIPVPVSMWKPWASDGAVANPFGFDNFLEVAGVRASVVICYEQLLPFALLWTFQHQPQIIVSVSNVWWAKGTSIPGIQRQTVAAFARLFWVPVISSQNS